MRKPTENSSLERLLSSYSDTPRRSMSELFELKLQELDINRTQALEAMELQSRTLNSLLEGKSTRIDFLSLLKFIKFLGITIDQAANIYFDSVLNANYHKFEELDRNTFILKNFDLSELKKEGIIHDISDFQAIEDSIKKIFNFSSIFDYRTEVINPTYSSAKLHSNTKLNEYWIEYARKVFSRVNNINPYSREALIDYFPKIRWHTMDVKNGLWEVIRILYTMGVTVIYLPKFRKLHLRGATFSVNKKPCIVLTDYKGFYPTLWFALLHELHHVLFDWDLIRVDSYHITTKTDLYTEKEIEADANQFARDYLFSEKKMNEILPYIGQYERVKEFSMANHVHESIPYIFYAFERNCYGWVKRFMPPIDTCLNQVKSISLSASVTEVAEFYKSKIYRKDERE